MKLKPWRRMTQDEEREYAEPPAAECVHCKQPFDASEGYVGEVSLCDRCIGR